MDVRSAVFCFLLLLSCSAQPMVADESEESTKDPDVDVTTTTPPSVEAPSIAKNCTTARNLAGMCVMRVHCEFSTTAIDRTLYATKDYVKVCKAEEVCCPFEFVVPEGGSSNNLKPHGDNKAAFEFDEDD